MWRRPDTNEYKVQNDLCDHTERDRKAIQWAFDQAKFISLNLARKAFDRFSAGWTPLYDPNKEILYRNWVKKVRKMPEITDKQINEYYRGLDKLKK